MDIPPSPPAAPSPAPAAPPVTLPLTTHTARSAQIALYVFLAITFGMLAFRGYGSWLGARPTETVAFAPLDLNKAERAELEQVPGLGPNLAREITDDRQKRGSFKTVEELRRVKGVGPATFDKVRAFLRVDPVPDSISGTAEPLVLERKPVPASAAPYPRVTGTRKIQPGEPLINVNTATIEQLLLLPGIGPVTAQNIISARSDKPFKTLTDLDRVKGIGPKTLDKIRAFVVME